MVLTVANKGQTFEKQVLELTDEAVRDKDQCDTGG